MVDPSFSGKHPPWEAELVFYGKVLTEQRAVYSKREVYDFGKSGTGRHRSGRARIEWKRTGGPLSAEK